MNNQLYTQIKTQLLTLVDDNSIPLINFVDRWNNQIENLRNKDESMEYPYNFPAVFIEFDSPNEIQSIGNNVQIYDPLNVILHIVWSELDTGDGNMENNFNVINFKQQVYLLMSLFRPTNTSNFVRFEEKQDYNHDNIYEYVQSYKCTFMDYDAQLPLGGSIAPLPSGGLPYGLTDNVTITTQAPE